MPRCSGPGKNIGCSDPGKNIGCNDPGKNIGCSDPGKFVGCFGDDYNLKKIFRPSAEIFTVLLDGLSSWRLVLLDPNVLLDGRPLRRTAV